MVLQKFNSMKKIILTLGAISFFAVSCSQNEPPATAEPADYAETWDELIQNPEKDSADNDSIRTDSAATAMPNSGQPQTAPPQQPQ